MNEENSQSQRGITFGEILALFRANLLLILIIVVLAGILGAVYSRVRKPYYTATETVSYSADVGATDSQRIKKNVNAMNAYIDTAVAFCTTGVVIDTANGYYAYYLNYGNKNPDNLGIDAFISQLKAHPEDYPLLSEEELLQLDYFTVSKVGSKASKSRSTGSSTDMFSFTISVKGLDKQATREKVRILAVAANHEITDYFGGVTSTIIELTESVDGVSVSVDMSARKIILIALLIGVVLAALVVFIKYALDNTVKDRETLENLTGSAVIAYIEDVKEADRGRTLAD